MKNFQCFILKAWTFKIFQLKSCYPLIKRLIKTSYILKHYIKTSLSIKRVIERDIKISVTTYIHARSSLIYNTSATRVRHERHKCNTSATGVTRVRHRCDTNDTSATRVKNFDFVKTRVKTYFHTLIFTIWQVKDYKERNHLILKTTFWKYLFSMPKCV